ncbi:hypothetical protein [Fibrobacter succinogenes]|uniref:hypothetical protein n=1 Tax=Fibrobacter succinogenes TaxID=833 RepID=UPI0013D1BD68|nr:hypothetical protein [Fibrobacter succinogenes]
MIVRRLKLFFAVALLATPFAYAGEFDDFEKSLMQDSESTDVADTATSMSTSDAFEQSLMSESGTETEKIYQRREALLESIKQGDTAQISQGVEELHAMRTEDLVPLADVEAEAVFIVKKMWPQLLKYEVNLYKQFYHEVISEQVRFFENDGLAQYLKNSLSSYDTSKTLLAHVENDIDNSSLPESDKLELKILLLLSDAYSDQRVNERIKRLSQMYLNKYPDHPDAKWIEKSVAGPFFRNDFLEFMLQDRAEHKEENIAKKFYTGGLGVNLFLVSGGLAFGMDNLYRSDLFEYEDPSIYLEIYLQFSRVSFSFELLPSGASGVATYSLGLGYVVYDSRYLKVRPYIGFGMPAMILEAKKDCYVAMPGGEKEYISAGDNDMYAESAAYTLAVNVDYKFGTAYFLLSNSMLTSFSLVGKFGISYMEFDDTFVKGSGVTPFFAFGLGLYLW